MKLNPFILIDWDPRDLSVPALQQRIAEKKKEWNVQKRGMGPKANEALEFEEQLREAEPLLVERKWKDPGAEARFQAAVAEAKKWFEAERRNVEEEADKMIAFLATKGHVSQVEFDLLVRKFGKHLPADKLRPRIRVPIRSERKPERKSEGGGEMLPATYDPIREDLKSLGRKDLFDYLDQDGSGTYTRKSSSRELAKRATEMRTELSRQNNKTSEVSARSRLLGQAQTIFNEKEPEWRRKYERSLDADRLLFLGKMLEFATLEGVLKTVDYEALLRRGMEAGATRDVVEEYLARKTRERKAILVKPSDSVLYQQEPCPVCAVLNDRAARFCRGCARPLAIDCPKCGKQAQSRDTACASCGFQLGEMSRAQPKVDEAQACFDRGDSEGALVRLAEALRYWPGLESAQQLSKRIEAAREEKKTALDRIRQHLANGELGQAEAICASVGFFPAERESQRVEFANLRRQADETFRRAQTAWEKKQESEAIRLLVQVMRLDRDHSGARLLAARLAPVAPPKPSASSKGDAIEVRWEGASASAAVSYNVGRRDLTAGEARPSILAAEITSHSYLDAKVTTGHTYEYCVASLSMGIASASSAASALVTATAEVSSQSALPGDRCVNLSWKPPAGAVQIRVVGKKDAVPANLSDGRPLSGVSLQGVVDFNVTNQCTYGYRIATVFKSADGSTVTSSGVTISARVEPLPERIENLSLTYTNGKIEARWPAVSRGGVHLLFVRQEPLAPGRVVDAGKLGEYGQTIPLESATLARFDPPGTGRLTFTILSQQAGTALAGASAFLEVAEDAQLEGIHFRVLKSGFFTKRLVLELQSARGSFLTPELLVHQQPKATPLRLGEGQLVQRIAPFLLTGRKVQIELQEELLCHGQYLGLLVADATQAAHFRIFKPAIETLRIA